MSGIVSVSSGITQNTTTSISIAELSSILFERPTTQIANNLSVQIGNIIKYEKGTSTKGKRIVLAMISSINTVKQVLITTDVYDPNVDPKEGTSLLELDEDNRKDKKKWHAFKTLIKIRQAARDAAKKTRMKNKQRFDELPYNKVIGLAEPGRITGLEDICWGCGGNNCFHNSTMCICSGCGLGIHKVCVPTKDKIDIENPIWHCPMCKNELDSESVSGIANEIIVKIGDKKKNVLLQEIKKVLFELINEITMESYIDRDDGERYIANHKPWVGKDLGMLVVLPVPLLVYRLLLLRQIKKEYDNNIDSDMEDGPPSQIDMNIDNVTTNEEEEEVEEESQQYETQDETHNEDMDIDNKEEIEITEYDSNSEMTSMTITLLPGQRLRVKGIEGKTRVITSLHDTNQIGMSANNKRFFPVPNMRHTNVTKYTNLTLLNNGNEKAVISLLTL